MGGRVLFCADGPVRQVASGGVRAQTRRPNAQSAPVPLAGKGERGIINREIYAYLVRREEPDVLKVAIVEDEVGERARLKSLFERYSLENKVEFYIAEFANAMTFLQEYKGEFDIAFLDIEMPIMDGMEAARHLRQRDKNVVIIFATNLKQYAIRGYEVNALGFVVKPVQYAPFCMYLQRAVREALLNREDAITLNCVSGVRRISASDIMYAEVSGHTLYVHTESETVKIYGSLSEFRKKVDRYYFLCCNVSYLVNPRYITDITKDYVVVGGKELKISRPRKKEFMAQLLDYFEKKEGGEV